MKVHPDLDSGYAWVVAVANCWVNFSVYGLYRSYGVLYVAFMEHYHVNHQTASWPFTLLCSVYHLIGPLVGLLSDRFTIRSLQLIGCLIASFGVLSAYFASEFIWVIILLGAVQGIGLGVIRTLSNVVIQQYFTKNRATATGIGMAGGTIASFFFPSFSEFIIENYGLKLSYVVFGAVMLQAMVGIVLEREPRWQTGHAGIANSGQSYTTINTDCEDGRSNEDETSDRNSNVKSVSKNVESVSEDEKSLPTPDAVVEEAKRRPSVISIQYLREKARSPGGQRLIFIMKQPVFWVITLTFITYSICLQVYLMTIVDVTMKNGIAIKRQAIFVITIFSAADLIGRVSFGWISDKGFARPKTIAIVCNISLCFFLVLIPIVPSLFAIQFCSFAIGLLLGIITILWPLLNGDYFGTDNLPLTLGLNCFFSGIESILRPFAIGKTISVCLSLSLSSTVSTRSLTLSLSLFLKLD